MKIPIFFPVCTLLLYACCCQLIASEHAKICVFVYETADRTVHYSFSRDQILKSPKWKPEGAPEVSSLNMNDLCIKAKAALVREKSITTPLELFSINIGRVSPTADVLISNEDVLQFAEHWHIFLEFAEKTQKGSNSGTYYRILTLLDGTVALETISKKEARVSPTRQP